MEVVRTNGLEIALRARRRGPPLLLVPGAAEDGRTYGGRSWSALSDEFTVVAWDEAAARRSDSIRGTRCRLL